MHIALTLWGNRISPVFDTAETLLLTETLRSRIIRQRTERIGMGGPFSLVQRLVEQEVDTLICGAISEGPALTIGSAGINLVPFMAGEANQVLAAYLSRASLHTFLMPGCPGSTERGLNRAVTRKAEEE